MPPPQKKKETKKTTTTDCSSDLTRRQFGLRALEAFFFFLSGYLFFGFPALSHLAVVVKTVLGSHFGVGEFTTHFRLYFGWIGMFTWGTIWVLTRGHLNTFVLGVLFFLIGCSPGSLRKHWGWEVDFHPECIVGCSSGARFLPLLFL